MPTTRPPKSSRRSAPPELPAELEAGIAAVRAKPDDFAAWDALDDVARDLDRPDEVLALYREMLGGEIPLPVAGELGRRGADFCEEWSEEPEPVVEILEQVLTLDRKQQWAFERLTVLLTSSSSWDQLLAVYDRAIAAAQSDDERVNLLGEAARVARDFAGQALRGSDYLKALLLLRPRDDQLAAALERRLDEQSRHTDLVEIWRARLAVLDSENAQRTRGRIAERFLEQLADPTAALAAVEEMLRESGDKTAAPRLLEAIAGRENADVGTRRAALTILDGLYAASENHEALVAVTERALRLASDDVERVRLHEQASRLLERLERLDGALAHSSEILRLDPKRLPNKERARELAVRMSKLDLYAEAVERAAERASGPLRVELWVEAGSLRRHELGNAELATALFSRVLGDEDADESARLLATQELTALLGAHGPSMKLLEVLETRADLEPKQSERSRVLGEAARLAETLGDQERALGLWARRLDQEKGDVDALSARIVLLEGLGRDRALVDDLSRRALLLDGGEKRADLVQAATVLAERLGDLPGAIAVWREIEASFVVDEQTTDALVDLSARAKEFEDVVRLLERAVGSETDAARRVSHLSRLGDTYRLDLDKQEQAIVEYQRALAIDPSAPGARLGLRALLEVPSRAHAAAEVLVESLRKSGEVAEIIALLEVRLGAAPDDAARIGMLLEASRLFETAQAPSDALRATCRAFALSLSEEVESDAARLAELTGDYVTLVTAYQKAIERAPKERAKALYFAQGRVWEERLGRPAGAAAAYKEALALAPADELIAFALIRSALSARLFQEAAWALIQGTKAEGAVPLGPTRAYESAATEFGVWDDALEALGEGVARASDLSAELTHDLKRQLALWHRDQRHDADAAEFVLRRAVLDHPRKDTLGMLAELERRAPGRPLVRTLEALADVTDDDLTVLFEAASVALEHVKERELSEKLLERTRRVASRRFEAAASADGSQLESTTEWAIENLVQLALGAGESARAIELLESGAALPFQSEKRTQWAFRAAQVAAKEADDARAVRLCKEVLEQAPTHEGAITLLASLHERAGRLEELLELRLRELELERPLERRLFLRLDLARVLGQLERDVAKRIEALSENLAAVPGHEGSLAALGDLLLGLERFEEATSLFEHQGRELARAEPNRAAALFERAGLLAEERLEDLTRLHADFKSAVQLVPSIAVLDRLGELAHDKGDYPSEVDWLERRLALTPEAQPSLDNAERRSTTVKLAQAKIASDDVPAARELLERELVLDAPAHEVRRVLCGLYAHAEEHEALAETLVAGVPYAPDDASRVELLRRAAVIVGKKLGDVARSIPLLDRASQLEPEDRLLRLGLTEALRLEGEFDRAREILTLMLEDFGRRRTKERAMVHEQLARIAEACEQLDEALEQAEAAAKIERTDPKILMLVGQLARRKGQLDRAGQAYQTLLLIVSRSTEGRESAEANDRVGESAILFELYRIAAAEGQEERARELLGSALEIATRDPAEALELEAELTAAGKADLLVHALEDRLNSGLEGVAASRVLVTKAQVLSKNGREHEAFEARLLAIAQTPDDGRLLEATFKVAEQLGRAPALQIELTRLAELPGQRPEIAGDLWFRLAAAAEPSDPLRAAGLYERAQLTEYKPRRTFVALDRLLSLLGDQQRSVVALRNFIGARDTDASPQALSDALYRLGEAEARGGDWAPAIEHFERALTLEAKEGRVLAALLPALEASAELPTEGVRLLVRVAREAGEPDVLLGALVRATELAEVDGELVLEAVELARNIGDVRRPRLLTRAIELYRSRDELPVVKDLLVERADLALALGDARTAADLLMLAVPCFHGERAVELELRFADLCRSPLGDDARALSAYEHLIEEVPTERRVWQPLFSLYRSLGRTADIEKAIAEIEPQSRNPEDLEMLRMERVRILLADGRFEDAEEVLRRTLAERPDFLEAASIFAELLADQGRHDEQRELHEDLLSKARQRADVDQIAHHGLALAALLRDTDRREAIEVLNAGLTWTRERRDVLLYLLELHGSDGEGRDRAEIMESLLAISQGPAAAELSLELAALQSELGDEYGMGRALELGFRALPADTRISELYLGYLTREEDYTRLAEACVVQATAATDASSAAHFYAQAGQVFDERLGDPERAAGAYESAFERDSENVDYLRKAVEHRRSLGEGDKALSAIAAAIEVADDMSLADLLELRAATLANERPDDVEALTNAERDLKRALSLFVSEEQAREIQGQRADYLLRLAELHAARGELAEERKASLELGRIQVEVGEVAAGVETLMAWLRQHGDDVEVAEELTALCMRAGDYDAAIFASQLAFGSSTGLARVRAVVSLADAAEKAGRPLEARDALLMATREFPDEAELRARLGRIYVAAGAHRELAEMLQVEAAASEDPGRRYALLMDAGDLLLKAGDGRSAIELFEQARVLAPEPYLITTKLADCYIDVGEVERAKEVLAQAIEAHGKRRSPELSTLQYALARVARVSGDVEGMYGLLEMALMSDRNNAEVAVELALRSQEDGRFDVAIRALQMITLSKGPCSMSKAEAYFRQAQIAETQGDAKKSALLARRALTTDEGFPAAQAILDRLGG